MPMLDTKQQSDNDEVILHIIGVVAGVGIGFLVFLSFLPAFILGAIIAAVAIWKDKKRWLNYALCISIIILVVLLLTGTWQSAFQFTFVPFNLLGLDQVTPYLEKTLNDGKSFSPNLLSYIYFVVLAIWIARIAYYFHERFQSRLVHSKKDEKEKEKESAQYQKVRKNWTKINAKKQVSWRRKQQKKDRIDDVFLGINQLGESFNISYKELKQHTLAQGTTGSGKTTALYSLLETALKNQDGFVMIDGKGDPGTIEEVQNLFDAYGRKLHVFHSSRKLTYNPFKNGGYTAGTNHLFNAFEGS